MKTSSAREIPIVKSDLKILVDEDDYHRFAWLNWYLNDNGYVVMDVPKPKRNLFPAKVRLHRLIIAAPSGMDVDHINGNKLDNRKSNLRVCTRSENLQNKEQGWTDPHRLKGAYLNKRSKEFPYMSSIQIPGSSPKKSKYLGVFKTEIEAHEAYMKASLELHGEYSVFRRNK